MPVLDKLKSFLRGATPAARLAEIEAAIAAAEGELKQHQDRRPAEIVAKLGGDPAAAERVAAIDQAMADLEARLLDLRDAAGELHRRIASAQAAAVKQQAEERPVRVAELRRIRIELVQAAGDKMAAAAEAIKALEANGDQLAELLDDAAARNFLNPAAFRHRARNAFARGFAIDPEGQLTTHNNLLGIGSTAVGAHAHWTLVQHEVEGLDSLAPFYASQAEAEAARERLTSRASAQRQGARDQLARRDRSRETIDGGLTSEKAAAEERLARPGPVPAIVPLPGGVFAIVPADRLYGDAAAARLAVEQAAMRRQHMAVVPSEGGFVLLPARFTGEAA